MIIPPKAVPDVDQALRRIALGFRVVGVVWLVLLAGVHAFVGGLARPDVVAVTAVITALWAAFTVSAARRGWGFVAADTGVAAAVVLAPALLGETAGFTGGYPFTAVVLALWAAGLAGAAVSAGALAVFTIARLVALGAQVTLPDTVQNLLFYAVGTAVLAWAVDLLRRNEARRRAAEDALADARAEQARAEERSATAAHLHDSVLQTLALVQRRADDEAAVRSLARRQERELRDWLFGERREAAAGTLADALAGVASEVERDHGVSVEVVTVGGAPVDQRVEALVAAAREALVNAAKHAGVDRVSLYAESDAAGQRVFVRDRGVGFDPDAPPGDGRGLQASIRERMVRAGGSAEVRSAPGRGTEVRLRLPAA